jgi:hypothetical protein
MMKALLDLSGAVNLRARGEPALRRDGRLILTERAGVIRGDLYVFGKLPFSLGTSLQFNIEGCEGEAAVILMDLAGVRLKVIGKVQGL